MTNQHPITPPPELAEAWIREANHNEPMFAQVAVMGAQWGADQELEACRDWLLQDGYDETSAKLCAARRSKPPSLKEQAFQALCRFHAAKGHESCTEKEIVDDYNTIRRALEALDD